MMHFFQRLFRLVLGLTFIVSGFIKISDPVLTGFLVARYSGIFAISIPLVPSVVAGIMVSVVEFTIGMCMLLRMRLRMASLISLIYASLFTLGSVYMLCNGQLRSWTAVLRNVAAVVMSLVIFIDCKKRKRIAPTPFEWAATSAMALLAALIAADAWIYGPRIDCSDLRVGTSFNEEWRNKRIVAVSVWDTGGMTPSMWDRVRRLRAMAAGNGDSFKILASGAEVPFDFVEETSIYPKEVLQRLVRSNGGAALFDDGVIVYKCPAWKADSDEMLSRMGEDSDITIAKENIHRTLFVYICAFMLIVVLMLVRHFCKSLYTEKQSDE